MLKSFSHNTWLTENIEIRTVDGWKNIYDLTLEDDLVIFLPKTRKYARSTIQAISKCKYSGVVFKYVNDNDKDSFVFAKNILPITLVTKGEKVGYQGELFNIEPNKGKLIVRGFTSYHGNNHDFLIVE